MRPGLLKRQQHIAIEVSDTDRSIEFYRRVLGFKLTERHSAHEVSAIPVELTFMRLGDAHHDLVLVHNPDKSYKPRPTRPEEDEDGAPSFHHYALECDSRQDWEAVLAHVRSQGATIVRGPVLHSFADPRGDGSWGENEAFYLLDPDGHRIEVFHGLATIAATGVHVNRDGQAMPGTSTEEL